MRLCAVCGKPVKGNYRTGHPRNVCDGCVRAVRRKADEDLAKKRRK